MTTLYCVDVVVEECDVGDCLESVSDLRLFLYSYIKRFSFLVSFFSL